MTAQLTLAFGHPPRDKAPRLTAGPRPGVPMGSNSKWDHCELGFRPTAEAHWQRERPTAPGVYAVVGRDGGLWLGDTRHTRDDWRGWWCSAPVEVTRALKRPLPPAVEWG